MEKEDALLLDAELLELELGIGKHLFGITT